MGTFWRNRDGDSGRLFRKTYSFHECLQETIRLFNDKVVNALSRELVKFSDQHMDSAELVRLQKADEIDILRWRLGRCNGGGGSAVSLVLY